MTKNLLGHERALYAGLNMFVLAVTGGVASGKSLFTEVFAELAGGAVERFDCDHAVHSLLADPGILLELEKRFGADVFDSEGDLNRVHLRDRVFASTDDRKYLEGLLHPAVLQQAEQTMRAAAERDEPPAYLLFEVPLLYEVDFSLQRDTDVVVAASLEVQLTRLRERRGLDDEMIGLVLKAQLTMEEKISRAHQVIWNDGSRDELIEGAHLLKAWIDKKVSE